MQLIIGSDRGMKRSSSKAIFTKACVGIFFAVAIMIAPALSHAGEAGLLLKRIAREASGGDGASFSKALEVGDEGMVIPCIIKASDPHAVTEAIVALGGKAMRIGSGGIVSAHIPPHAIDAIIGMEDVDFVEAASMLSSKMNTARYASNVVSVQDGTALDVPYNGAGIIVGDVDDALDYGHPDFMDANGISRVQFVQQTVAGSAVTCSHAQVVADTCDITDGGQGLVHGTHVTGIMAGSNATYTGVAPQADIAFVFNNATDADTGGSFATAVIEGVSAIFTQADTADKAAVVNLSLGTSIGAHDGTSLMEQGLDELVASKPGRIIVNAAGNEQVIPAGFSSPQVDYVGGIHAGINVAVGTSVGFRIGIWNGPGAASAFTGGTLVDVWLGDGLKDNCSITAFAYTEGRDPQDYTFPGLVNTDNNTFTTVTDVPFATDTASPVTSSDGSVQAQVEVDATDARNGKPHAMVLLSAASGLGADLATRWFDVVIRATGAACTGNMWLYYDYVPFHDFLKNVAGLTVGDATYVGYTLADGDSQLTTTIPATANKVIAVGSFMPPKPEGASTSEWTGNNGTTYNQSDYGVAGGLGSTTNDLSSFSSLGPTADGRTKPAIVAPGEPIVAAKATNAFTSASISVGEDHFKSGGTSMASPHVAGIVALLLERNNTLTADQVRTALQTGADTSGMTAKSPDAANSYGSGKVNAASVLQSVSVDHSAYSGGGDSGSSSKCSLVPQAAFPSGLIGLSIILLIAVRRRRPAR